MTLIFSHIILLAGQHALIWDAPSIIIYCPWIIYLLHLTPVCSLSESEERLAREKGWIVQYTRLDERRLLLQTQCNS